MKALSLPASILCTIVTLLMASAKIRGDEAPLYDIELTTASRGFDGKTCWVHPRAGAIPPGQPGNAGENPLVVMTTQKLLLSGSDVYYALHALSTSDLGRSWSQPVEQAEFVLRVYQPGAWSGPRLSDSYQKLLQPEDELTVCDFTPKWHAATQTLLGIGQTVAYRKNRIFELRPRATTYATFDPIKKTWGKWQTLELPDVPELANFGSGSAQRLDLAGGEILLPMFYRRPGTRQNSVAVCRCSFDGKSLRYLGHGKPLTVEHVRGLLEPSLTMFDGRYYLTMRNDLNGYLSVSDDGLNYSEPQIWKFDDGANLGNYNTQQHWVAHSDGLHLVYTRKGANNEHVFRHRAPLFIARIDPQGLRVIRATEQVLVPERGARLGNFGVTEVGPDETWVTVAEWMQPLGVEKYGSDNSIFVAKIRWRRPNRLAQQP